MKSKDILSGLGIIGVILFFALAPQLSESMKAFMGQHGFVMAFLKFGVLCTLGESIALRITKGVYHVRGFGVWPRVLMWGVIGMCIHTAFIIFATGTPHVLAQFGFSPDKVELSFFEQIGLAFAISTTMNLLFAPLFMTAHAVVDMHIAENDGSLRKFFQPIQVTSLLRKINWNMLWGFAIKKTLPLFWIPAHTITFLLPQGLRVLFAAALGIVLGIILAVASQKPDEAPLPAEA